MAKLTKIERVRFSEQDIVSLQRLGKKKSKFIREAVREKIERDKPKILAEQRRKLEKECPF